MKKLFLLIFIAFAFIGISLAQVTVDSVRIYYKRGYREIDTLYKDNRVQLSRFLQMVRKAHSENTIEQLVINSYASPDGMNKFNERLSAARAECVRAYLLRHTEVPESLIKKNAAGIAWTQLRTMVAESDMPYCDEVLDVIDRTPVWVYDAQHRIIDGRKKRLMDLRGGIPYKYMYEHMFPELRSSMVVSLYLKTRDGQEIVAENVDTPSVGELNGTLTDSATVVKEPSSCKETEEEQSVPVAARGEETVQRLALKTNLLYDAILMPSLEVEYRFNDRWSVNLEGEMAWWKNDGKHKYYQLATVSPEVRYWFKTRKPWHGHYVGAFGGFSWYDLENGRKGYQGEAQMVGVSYGYMWPIVRRLSLETGIGLGFLHTRYEEYLPQDGHYVYQQTKQTNYFGPLKLKFALVWRLWNESKQKKGGVR